jgi:hypothetical protein
MTITFHDVLTAINEIRRTYTAPPTGAEMAASRRIDVIASVDAMLLDLQERILDAHGDKPQGEI